MIKKLKRQASILAKECNLQHSAALDLASKLNGFKDYHQAQKEYEVREPSGKCYIDVDPQGIVLLRGKADQRIGLPVYVTDSRSHATKLVVRLCSKSIDGEHYLLPDTLFKSDLPEMEAVKQLQGVKDAFAKLDNQEPLQKLMLVTKPVTGNCYRVKAKTVAEVATFFTVFGKNLDEALAAAREEAESQEQEAWEVTYLEGPTRITDIQNELDPKEYQANEEGL